NEEELKIFKEAGRIKDLRDAVDSKFNAQTGIGHTRWATHGAPSVMNAHPHQSADGRFTIVHNGVIENYEQIKEEYLQKTEFVSSTDTEIIVELISEFSKQSENTEAAFKKVLDVLHGSYALGLMDNEDEDVIYVAKNKSPLLLGKGDGFNVITSDAMEMLHKPNDFVELMDGEVVTLKKDEIVIKDKTCYIVARDAYIAEVEVSHIKKGTDEHD